MKSARFTLGLEPVKSLRHGKYYQKNDKMLKMQKHEKTFWVLKGTVSKSLRCYHLRNK